MAHFRCEVHPRRVQCRRTTKAGAEPAAAVTAVLEMVKVAAILVTGKARVGPNPTPRWAHSSRLALTGSSKENQGAPLQRNAPWVGMFPPNG